MGNNRLSLAVNGRERQLQSKLVAFEMPDPRSWDGNGNGNSIGLRSVAIVGLGYVGLPTALALHGRCPRIIGIDVSQERLDEISARGADLAYGRTLPRALRRNGLVDVAADAYFPVTGPACTVLERATVEQTRAGLVAAGLATDEEIERLLVAVDSGGLDFATSPMITAWGRKPGTAGSPPH